MENNRITADELCRITGLTDRRHRQIAQQGFFPPPKKGVYQRLETLSGLFNYYRTLNDQQDEELKAEMILKARAERKLKERELSVHERGWVTVEDAFLASSVVLAQVRRSCLLLPQAVTKGLVGCTEPEISAKLVESVDGIFQSIKEGDFKKMHEDYQQENQH